MEEPLSLEMIRRLNKWPILKESILKNRLPIIDSSVKQTNSEDTNEDEASESMEEENPALEGHFLMERASLDVTVLDSCVCKCHQDETMTFKLTLPFSCSKCSQQFCCKCQFLVHREFHRGERKYECSECGKSYFYKSDLVRHQPVHSQVKPHVCKVCGRSFNQVGHLITHRLVHTGEKPFSCDVCHKPFNRKSNLQKHKMIHTGERPFQCAVCGSRFSRKGDLQRHQMLHTGERPYKCDICEKSFSQKPHLVSHRAIHTGDRPYKCLACGRSFNRKNHLLKHQIEKCPELAMKRSDGSNLTLTDFTNLSSNSFLNFNHLLASKDESEEESTVEKSYFNSLDIKPKVVIEEEESKDKPSELCKLDGMSLLRARLSDPTFVRSKNGQENSSKSAESLRVTVGRKSESVSSRDPDETSKTVSLKEQEDDSSMDTSDNEESDRNRDV